jgi:hypothetical protein
MTSEGEEIMFNAFDAARESSRVSPSDTKKMIYETQMGEVGLQLGQTSSSIRS